MDLRALAGALSKDGWKDVAKGSHLDVEFDLVGRRWFTLTRWNVLVASIPRLDAAAAQEWKKVFEELNERSKSWVWGRCFLLCLVADEVAPEILEGLRSDTFGLFGLLRLRGGGGRYLIADGKEREVYGEVPALPLDAHMYTGRTKATLERCL